MAHYMVQVGYKDEQIKALTANPQDRAAAARQLVEGFGGKMHQFFFAFGESDVVLIAEVPDNETAAACSMAVVAAGTTSHFRTTVLLTMEEAMNAMRKAGATATGYAPPSG